jgi:hypothetical protein
LARRGAEACYTSGRADVPRDACFSAALLRADPDHEDQNLLFFTDGRYRKHSIAIAPSSFNAKSNFLEIIRAAISANALFAALNQRL